MGVRVGRMDNCYMGMMLDPLHSDCVMSLGERAWKFCTLTMFRELKLLHLSNVVVAGSKSQPHAAIASPGIHFPQLLCPEHSPQLLQTDPCRLWGCRVQAMPRPSRGQSSPGGASGHRGAWATGRPRNNNGWGAWMAVGATQAATRVACPNRPG